MNKVDIIRKHIGNDDFYDMNGTSMLTNILNAMEDYKEQEVKNCSIPNVGLTLPLPDKNSMQQIAQHVRKSEESRDPLIYEQGILRGMEIMKNIVSGN